MLGTPEYMSPEQTLNAAKADIRADIYSLGCTLYYMLAGHAPFRGTHGEILMAHAQRDPQSVNLVRPDVPPELAAVIDRMMAKTAEKRYQTPNDVITALSPFMGATSAPGRPGGEPRAAPAAENDLAASDRETSVDAALPSLALDTASQLDDSKSQLAAIASLTGDSRRSVTQILRRSQPQRARASKNWPAWVIPTCIVGLLLVVLGGLWAGGVFRLKTPEGTIVVEQLPEDADVLVDGQRLEIAWNQGKDRAEIQIAPGEHNVEVLVKNVRVTGESVTVAAGKQSSLKVRIDKENSSTPTSAELELTKNLGSSIEAIDLLQLIDPSTCTVSGKWVRLGNRSIVSARGENDIVQIPYQSPRSYLLEIEGERAVGRGELQIGVVVGAKRCRVMLDAGRRSFSGISLVSGKEARDNHTFRRGQVLPDNRPFKIAISVKQHRLSVFVNGANIIDWKGDDESLSVGRGNFGAKQNLFLTVWAGEPNVYRIDAIKLKNLNDGSVAPLADDSTPNSADPFEIGTVWFAEMRALAETIKVTVADGQTSKEAKLIDKPLFRFSDPSLHTDGLVWAWVIAGRPVMMTESRFLDRTKGVWIHDLVATSDVRVAAEVGGHGRWAPRGSDFKLMPVPESRAPSPTEADRLLQMKQFASKLTASQVWQGQASELRLLPTEIHRYSHADSGLVDGAAFAFAVGSNPEAILFVEAHKSGSGELSWMYGLARMSAAAVTFKLGEAEVWTVPQSFGNSTATYYCFTRAVPAADTPDLDAFKKSIDQ
jgi:hypothetical protein